MCIRDSLNGLLGVSQIILSELQSEDIAQLRDAFEISRTRILDLVDHALLLTQIEVEAEKFAPGRVPLAAVLRTAVEQMAAFADSRQVKMEWALPEAAFIAGNYELLVTALGELLETSVKFSKPGGVVRLDCSSGPGVIQITMKSFGFTVPIPAISKFFDLFAIDETATAVGHLGPVSYTHLDVYKRQPKRAPGSEPNHIVRAAI